MAGRTRTACRESENNMRKVTIQLTTDYSDSGVKNYSLTEVSSVFFPCSQNNQRQSEQLLNAK
jgi:hypothetical protein